VRDDIPEPGNLFPFNGRVAGFQIVRQVLCRFTDDLEIPDNRVLEYAGLLKIRDRSSHRYIPGFFPRLP
jgi:hypothetical protein